MSRYQSASWLCCGQWPYPCSHSEASLELWWWLLWLRGSAGKNSSTASFTVLHLGAGCVFNSFQNCNRKGTLLFNNIFSIVPAIMMGVCEISKSYELIIAARVIVGICAGWTFHLKTFNKSIQLNRFDGLSPGCSWSPQIPSTLKKELSNVCAAILFTIINKCS